MVRASGVRRPRRGSRPNARRVTAAGRASMASVARRLPLIARRLALDPAFAVASGDEKCWARRCAPAASGSPETSTSSARSLPLRAWASTARLRRV